MEERELSISDNLSKNTRAVLGRRSLLTVIIVILVVIAAVGSSIYFYTKYQNAKNVLGNSTKVQVEESTSLINKIGKLIELPKDENPRIATVSDITKLKGDSFFKNAKNGDKILIYVKAKKAILYDPVSNKIVNVQAITLGPAEADTATASTSASPTPGLVRVVILNGTRTVGLAAATEKKISALKNITVVSKADARANYIKTIIIDLSGKNGTVATELAKVLSGEVGKLPVAEVKPTNADMLVILGGK
jgi:hypothetical protein